MNIPLRSSLWILCALLVCPLAFADNQSRDVPWLSNSEAKTLSDSVPPPPVPGSPEDRADLAAILKAQADRTPAVLAECRRDEHISFELFNSVYGTQFTPENSPLFFALLKSVQRVTGVVNESAKLKYHRLRPYQGHPDVVKSVFPVSQFSYPSGHSMASYTDATIFGVIFPEKKQAFLDRAAQIAQSRVNAGVHYPSDIKEGEVLGKATAAALLANPSFQADLKAVQAELKK